ncbi:hypothetical protein H9C73_05595 [Marinobacterium sp. AK62]|uniref:Uncharacterized protein n=1 Tax=Marinobacterium alkalitolerans TaxID=1542925 RepID=A0ABS3Z916_9GAMM|nr:lipocalin family protein [Marinobacterium alkalitolerans]MBP0048202.1 hypothetical protein [Marinobacterium alkalitolerans]
MKKWIGAGVLAAAAGAGLAWQQGWLGSTSETSMAHFVPADTVMYIGGKASAEQVAQLRDMPLMGQSQLQIQQLLAEMDNLGRDETPQARFATVLLREFLGNATTYGSTVAHFGLDPLKPQAIYMDGLMPVLRFGIQDEQQFWRVFDQASTESGLKPRTLTLEGTSVKLWRLTQPGDQSLELAVTVHEGIATLTAFHFLDQENDQLQRLALKAPDRSLADSGELAQLKTDYGFDDSLQAFIHLERLTQGILDPDSIGLGQDLKALLQARGKPLPTERLDAACRADISALVAQVPRFVAGNTGVSTDNALAMQSRSVLELTHAELVSDLRSLRGHIPSHSGSTDQILGLGMGLNVDNLIPTVTSMVQRFRDYPTECAELQQAQRQLAGANPAMLGMFTGMIQGTRGAGFSLFDLAIDPNTLQPTNLDFLLSIATENPNALLGMLAMSPMGRQIQIPTDGSLADIDLSHLIPGLSLKAGMQGKHLVAFSGEQAGKAAAELEQEALDANGHTRLSADYNRLADLISNLPTQVAVELESGTSTGCVAQAQIANMLRTQGAQVRYDLDFSEQGMDTRMAFSLDPSQVPQVDPVGSWTLMDQSYDCQGGEPIGVEEIRADGTGQYRYNDGQCDLYRTNYTWTQSGNLFTLTATENVSRDDCTQDWTTEAPVNSQCILIPLDEGFRCIYSDEDSESLFHYRPAG